jgi:hypothetical protein
MQPIKTEIKWEWREAIVKRLKFHLINALQLIPERVCFVLHLETAH